MFSSSALLALSILVLRLRGNGWWLAWLAPATIFTFTLLSGLHLGLSVITGEGLNNAVFYHIAAGLEGADISQYAFHIAAAGGAIVAVGVLLWRLRRFLRGNAKEQRWFWDLAVVVLALGALATHPVVTASAAHFLRFSVVAQQTEGFNDPATELALPEKPRNLVIIYLESLERTYMDSGRFPDLTPRLSALEARSLHFTGLGQTVGADFTVGGMVATQCGTPLILSGGANSGKMTQFLSGATCLGDLLSTAGYQLSYMGGASTAFAGKGAFYQTHGYDEVSGFDELGPELVDPDYYAEWGLQDDTLFDLAGARFSKLAAQDQPFVLTLLTLDTHHPNGHANTNRACKGLVYGDGANPMLNSVLCNDLLAGRFVEDILTGPHGSDTVIAVMSDHLAMVNTAADQLNAGPRRNLLMILDGSRTDTRRIDRAATTLDTGPTLLSYLGLDLPRLGFGVDLMRDEKTLPERLGVSVDDRPALDNHLMGYQEVYDRLWNLPGIAGGAYINLERKEIQFGPDAFGLPALFAIDQDQTVSTLIIGDAYANETLTEAAQALPDGTRYLWFDDCAALELGIPESDLAPAGSFCLMGGERQGGFALRPIERSGYLSAQELAALWPSEGQDATEPAALQAIGTARGDLPTPLGLKGLATGNRGVLLQLADFDNGASFVRRQTTEALTSGEDWLLERGISLVGLTAEGGAEILDRLDQCDPAFDAAAHGLWKDRISTPGQFVGHLILVHDSAFCSDDIKLTEAPLSGLDLPVLRALPKRKAYAALINSNGKAFEISNPGFSRIRLYLKNDGPVPVGAALALSATPTPPSAETVVSLPSSGGPETPESEPTGPEPAAEPAGQVVQTAGCLVPSVLSPTPAKTSLPLGTRIGETDLQDHVGTAEGWWDAEPFGRWTGSKTASLSIILPETSSNLSLSLELSTYQEEAFTVRAVYSGKTMADFQVAGDQVVQVELSGLPRGKPVDLVLEMIGPDLACPAMTGAGSDTRQLGLMLKGLTVTATSAPAAAPALAALGPVASWPVLDQPQPSTEGCILPDRIAPAIPALLALPLGEPVTVPAAIGSGMLAFGPGWWADEEFGRWMAVGPASIAVTLPEEPSGLTLSLTAALFGGKETLALVSHNGREIGRGQIVEGRPLVVDLSMLPRGETLILNIGLEDAGLVCPATLGQSADTRTLGLMLQAVTLAETSSPGLSPAVAHGGGLLDGTAITNSLEALTLNQGRFDLIEVDLNWTSDGELVCLHDWEETFASRFGDQKGPVDLATFRDLLAQTPDKPANCDLETLAGWLRENPGPRIVTDIKADPVKGLALIAQRYPELMPRFVPQAYLPDEIAQLRALGYPQVIWTLYRFGSDREAILQEAKAQQPSAITMPVEMARSGLLSTLEIELEVPLYVHTVNDKDQAACLLAMGATGLYSDVFAAADLNAVPEPTGCDSLAWAMR
jgi:phosphoglycerol transferase